MSEWVNDKPSAAPAPRLRRAHFLGLGFGALVGFLVMIGFSLLVSIGGKLPPLHARPAAHLARDVPDVVFKAPAYTNFVNQNGDKVSSSAFDGKVRVVSFLFPLCSSMCPVIASHLVNLEHQLNQAGLSQQVRLVSFDVAAGKTTYPEMASFMREFGGNPKSPEWQFLTSNPQAMAQVVRKGYHEYFHMISMESEMKIFAQQKKAGTFNYQPDMHNSLAEKVHPDFDVTHSSSLILVGQHGQVRYVLNNADTVPVSVILKKIKAMLNPQGVPA